MKSVYRKRAYQAPAQTDGLRVLVDRLWPRGLSKESAKIDLWLKEIAPSTQLRQWFGHDPAQWAEFQQRYRAELKTNPALQQLHSLAAQSTVTLVYAAKDEAHNNAVVLQALLQEGDRHRT